MPLPQHGSPYSPSGPPPSEAVDEAMITRLVGSFYTCVRADPVQIPEDARVNRRKAPSLAPLPGLA